MTAKEFNQWRIMPRLMTFGYAALMYQVGSWFMSLTDPTNAQAAFVSTMVGASAAVFGLYTHSGNEQ